MKDLAYCLSIVVAIAIALMGLLRGPELSARIRDRSLNDRVYRTVVRPATDWVIDYHKQHGELPTESAFASHAESTWPGWSLGIYTKPPKWQRSWGQIGKDFLLCAQPGEWILYKQSWDGDEWKAWTD